jgi:hypothetical protein
MTRRILRNYNEIALLQNGFACALQDYFDVKRLHHIHQSRMHMGVVQNE